MRRFKHALGVWACALLVLPLGNSARASILVAKTTNPANGHDYYLLNQSTWTAAESEAVSMGGHLATVRNAQENTFIYNTFAPHVPPPTGTLHHWLAIGLKEFDDQSGWFWRSGEPFVYSNWDPTQPDNNAGFNENLGGIALPPLPPGLWHDVREDRPTVDLGWGVVEVIPEPTTATAALVALSLTALARSRRRTGDSPAPL